MTYRTFASVAVAFLLTAVSMVAIPHYFRSVYADKSLGKEGYEDECKSSDLDLAADGHGNHYLVYNCPNEDQVRFIAMADDAKVLKGDGSQILANGVGDTDVTIALYGGGTTPAHAMPLVVVERELTSYVCDPDDLFKCTVTVESPTNPIAAKLTVKKVVIGGEKAPAQDDPQDFIIHVSGPNVRCLSTENQCSPLEGARGTLTFRGSQEGTAVAMDPGEYSISEELHASIPPEGYSVSYSLACQADVKEPSIGRGTLESGADVTCIVTNTCLLCVANFVDNANIISASATTTAQSLLSAVMYGSTPTLPTINNLNYDDGGIEPKIIPVHQWTSLVTQVTGAQHPVVASGPGKTVYAAWEDDGKGGKKDIFFNVGTVEDKDGDGVDDFIDWKKNPPLNLSQSSASSLSPRIAVSGTFGNPGDNVYVTFEEQGDIEFSLSTNQGDSFSEEAINLSKTSTPSVEHEMAADHSNVYVVFADSIKSNQRDIWLKVGTCCNTNGGIDFSANKRIETTDFNSFEPDVAVKGKIVDIVWEDSRFTTGTRKTEPMFTQSTDGGNKFVPPIDVGNTIGTSTKVLVSIPDTDTRFVAWKDNAENPTSESYKIYAVMSTNGGKSFTSPPDVYGDAKSALSPTDLDGKVCAWDTHCRYCQSREGYDYYSNTGWGGWLWGLRN